MILSPYLKRNVRGEVVASHIATSVRAGDAIHVACGIAPLNPAAHQRVGRCLWMRLTLDPDFAGGGEADLLRLAAGDLHGQDAGGRANLA